MPRGRGSLGLGEGGPSYHPPRRGVTGASRTPTGGRPAVTQIGRILASMRFRVLVRSRPHLSAHTVASSRSDSGQPSREFIPSPCPVPPVGAWICLRGGRPIVGGRWAGQFVWAYRGLALRLQVVRLQRSSVLAFPGSLPGRHGQQVVKEQRPASPRGQPSGGRSAMGVIPSHQPIYHYRL